jgi:hypothetical protein
LKQVLQIFWNIQFLFIFGFVLLGLDDANLVGNLEGVVFGRQSDVSLLLTIRTKETMLTHRNLAKIILTEGISKR